MNTYEIIKENEIQIITIKNQIKTCFKSNNEYCFIIYNETDSTDYFINKTMFMKYCTLELKRLKKRERKLKKLIALRYLIPRKLLENPDE